MGYLPVTLCGPRTTVIVWRVLVVLGSLLFLLLQLLQFSQAVCPLLCGQSSRGVIHPGLDGVHPMNQFGKVRIILTGA